MAFIRRYRNSDEEAVVHVVSDLHRSTVLLIYMLRELDTSFERQQRLTFVPHLILPFCTLAPFCGAETTSI